MRLPHLPTSQFPRTISPGPDGEHDAPLLTYFLTSSAVKLTPLDVTAYKGIQGTFAEAAFSAASVPAVIPYVTNLVSDGVLMQDVLNTTQFLDDWVELSAQANDAGDGLHAMPALAAAKQCFGQYQESATQTVLDTVPPNAMIRFDSNPSEAVLVDVFDVRASDDGAGYVMTLRQVPAAAAATPAREGVCHAKQSISADGTGSAEHYHHQSSCMETILDWNVEEASAVDGDGMVMFIKLRIQFVPNPPPIAGIDM